METTATPGYAQGATLEDVRATLRDIAERQKEFDREMEKSAREWNKRFGDLSNRFGELAEHLVAPGIEDRFNELGYHFDDVSPNGRKIKENGKTVAEIDILLENTETVMAVEVKAKPAERDVEEHVQRLEILRNHRHKKNDTRKIQGAIAGAVFGTAAKKATLRAGLFVLEQSGDTMKIDIPDGFVPREW